MIGGTRLLVAYVEAGVDLGMSCAGQTAGSPAADSKKADSTTKQYPEWQPGQLHKVTGGGAEVQSLLDRLEANAGIAVVIWFAGWAETCRACIPALERCFLQEICMMHP